MSIDSVYRFARLRVFALLLLISVSAPAPAAAQKIQRYPASASQIAYMGRSLRGDPVLWTWPGSGLRVGYSHSAHIAIHLRADDAPDTFSHTRTRLVWYRIDGCPWMLLPVPPDSDADYPLIVPPGSANGGLHVLDVVKASEGQLTFGGIVLDPTGILARAALPAHRIEIVGDSITAGFKVYGPGDHGAAFDHDARASYGSLIGDQLDAEVRLIAFSGAGLVHNYGQSPVDSRPMPAYYPYLHRDLTIPNDWSWQPEIVIVNLGTNDMTPPGPTPPDTFQAAYTALLSMLHSHNPKAYLIALQPFGLLNGTMAVYPDAIRGAVETQRAANDAKVMYVDTAGWLGAGDFTDGTHPNAQGQRKAADRLLPILRAVLHAAG